MEGKLKGKLEGKMKGKMKGKLECKLNAEPVISLHYHLPQNCNPLHMHNKKKFQANPELVFQPNWIVDTLTKHGTTKSYKTAPGEHCDV